MLQRTPHLSGTEICYCPHQWDHSPEDVYWKDSQCPVCWVFWTGNPVARERQGNLCSSCYRDTEPVRRGRSSCRCAGCAR